MRVAFVGDICLETNLDLWSAADVPDLHDALGADIVVGNFEAVVDGSAVGSADSTKICLSAPAGVLRKLREIGVDYLSVANNHAADFGSSGLRHT
ncbi:CapA family protein, partial [bacterium]|nr:CapA family protein [bacterium]